MNTNILITSAGKRVSLVSFFKENLNQDFPIGKVYTSDMNPLYAPAGYISDHCFSVPPVTDSNYLNCLISICQEYKIGLVVPTIDTELLLLAKNKTYLKDLGIHVIVPDLEFVEDCRDKRRTANLLERLSIRVPESRDKNKPIFPMFAKPYDGSLSKDLYILNKKEDLTAEILANTKLIFMEYIDKQVYKEYTVDLYYGKDNCLKCIVPRERIEIRAGEINKGCTRKNYLVSYLKERMAYLPGVIGCICIQLFYRESDHDVVGIEINPRFGGGYPMSYHAGANYPKYLIQEYLENKDLEYTEDWKDNTLLLRYDKEVVVYDSK